MRWNGVLTSLGAAFVLFNIFAQPARAAEGSLVGRWVHKDEGLRVDMDFSPNGQCTVIAAAGGKTSAFTGTYKLGPGEVVITPKDAKPITYTLQLSDHRLSISGGTFGDVKLDFSNPAATAANVPESVAPVAPGPARPGTGGATTRPLADDKGDKKDEKPDEVKLPGGGTCDTTALEARFKVLKVKADPANGKVTWVMEAKEDVTSIVAEGTLYDEDEVRIGVATILVEPNAYIKKGDHVRFTLTLPADTVMQKVKKISIK